MIDTRALNTNVLAPVVSTVVYLVQLHQEA